MIFWRCLILSVEASSSFSEEKGTKKTFLCWAMGAGEITPEAQSHKSFCGAFFKKRLLAFSFLNQK
jgi:hypothetical protein